MLRFYGPVNPMGSCQARSVYLTFVSMICSGDMHTMTNFDATWALEAET